MIAVVSPESIRVSQNFTDCNIFFSKTCGVNWSIHLQITGPSKFPKPNLQRQGNPPHFRAPIEVFAKTFAMISQVHGKINRVFPNGSLLPVYPELEPHEIAKFHTADSLWVIYIFEIASVFFKFQKLMEIKGGSICKRKESIIESSSTFRMRRQFCSRAAVMIFFVSTLNVRGCCIDSSKQKRKSKLPKLSKISHRN